MDVVEKLRKERIERQKKRQAELKQYEQELTRRREQRKAEREMRNNTAKYSSSIMAEFTSKTIQDSLRLVEASKAREDMKIKELRAQQKASEQKREIDREELSRQKKQLRESFIRRRQRKLPPKPKRYIVQPAEFYGIDFSNESDNFAAAQQELKDELIELSRQREEELMMNPQKMNQIINAGDVILKGLAKMSRSQESDETKKLDDIISDGQNKLSGSDASIGDQLKDRHENLKDYFEAPLEPEEESAETEQVVASKLSQRKWFKEVKKTKVDYSDYFPSNIGMVDGIMVFRIEDMKPELIDIDIGQLCLGDCYIVLHTFVHDDGYVSSKIYQWVGEDASIDKKACSAIFSVALRDLLNLESEVQREDSYEESKEFKDTFHAYGFDFIREDAAFATSSGLYTVEETIYPLLVYKVFTKMGKIRTNNELVSVRTVLDFQLVEPKFSSFDPRYCFIVDNGLEVYQWNGKKATLSDKMKCRMFAKKIVEIERPPGKAKFFEVDQEEEDADFKAIFHEEFKNSDEYPLSVDINDQSSDLISENPCKPTEIALFVFDDRLVDYPDTSKLNLANFLYFPAPGYPHSQPSRTFLRTDCCAVLDTGNEIFYWIGKKSSNDLRNISQDILMNKIAKTEPERPSFISTAKLMEGVESEVFKARFFDWDASIIRQIDYTKEEDHDTKKPNDKLSQKVDIAALFTPPPSGKNTKDEEKFIENLFTRANELLQTLQAFRFDSKTKKFVKIPDWTHETLGREGGHFWSEDVYVFLCVYEKQVSEEEQEFDEDHPIINYECISYVWSGRHTRKPSIAMLTFTHEFKNKIMDLISQASGGDVELKTVYLEQEKEALALLAHLKRAYVVHAGKRPNQLPSLLPVSSSQEETSSNLIKFSRIRLYHIRLDNRYQVCRAVQVTPMVTSLSTRNAYLLQYLGCDGNEPSMPSNTFLWIGRGVSKIEETAAVTIAQKILNLRMDISGKTLDYLNQCYTKIKEKSEPDTFWKFLAPTYEKPSSFSPIPYGQGYFYSIPPPRLFVCSNEDGFFRILDNGCFFSIGDLKPGSLCFLDAGPGLGSPYQVWVWISQTASDVLIKLSKKALESYLEHLNDGRTLDMSDWDTNVHEESGPKKIALRKHGKLIKKKDVVHIQEGNEPADFRAFFLGWGDDFRIDRRTGIQSDVSSIKEEVYPLSKQKEPSNRFLEEQKERRRKKKLEKEKLKQNQNKQ